MKMTQELRKGEKNRETEVERARETMRIKLDTQGKTDIIIASLLLLLSVSAHIVFALTISASLFLFSKAPFQMN